LRTWTPALLVAFGTCLWAQHDGELMHWTNVGVALGAKTELTLATRMRVREQMSRYSQTLAGAMGTHQLLPRLWVLGGYYYIDRAGGDAPQWGDAERVFAGAVARLVNRPGWALDSRTLFEHIAPEGRHSTRSRERLAVTLPRRGWEPMFTAEMLRVLGQSAGRFGAHVARPLGHGVAASVGYEMRQYPGSGYGHLLVTQLTFHPFARR
jgi:hypothetical protein